MPQGCDPQGNQDYLLVCKEAVRRAGAVLMDHWGHVTVRHKGRSDLVTEADLAAQETVRQTLREAFPTHSMIGEEDPPEALVRRKSSEFCWIVDPLDGTTNYVHGVPFFCVSLALEYFGKLIVGVVYNPASGECFTAEVGKGAQLNGKPIQASGVTTLDEALISAGFPAAVTRDDLDLRLFNEVVLVSQSVRRSGSAALNLAYVAAGRFDALWACQTKVWDVAAGTLLIREAGGTVTAFDGEPLASPNGPVLAASTPQLHEAMSEMIRAVSVK